MNEKRLRVAKPVLVSATLATIVWVSAGSLTPPGGPIASTMKDLATVEPRIPISATTTPGDADSLFRIVSRGSYYLTGNIIGVVGKSGIEIVASGVTVDLMGFDLVGVPGSLSGVVTSGVLTDIAVINGSVRNWDGDGVALSGIFNTRLADLRVSGNAGDGIDAGGNAVIIGCAARLNGAYGIRTNSNGTITNCSARENVGIGIYANQGSITNCSAVSNTGDGISTTSNSTITGCSANNNGGDGISTLYGTAIINCSASSNTLDGIAVSNDCFVRSNICDQNGNGSDGAGIHAVSADNRIEGNNCVDNDRGIDVDSPGNFITRNTCSGNTTDNWDVVLGNNILVVVAVDAGIVLGNSGGVAPGSTDPNANFTY